MRSLIEMIERLKRRSGLIGLVEYGGRHYADTEASGDYDLYAIFATPLPPVESLHFYIDAIPVDLNLITLEELRAIDSFDSIPAVTLDGRVIYDPTGQVARTLDQLRERRRQTQPVPPDEHTIAYIRHGHKHVFDKMQGRQQTMPLLCQLLLHGTVYWLVRNYFHIRSLLFQGERQALAYFERYEPAIYHLLDRFYQAETIEEQEALVRELSELVLAPVGGMWRANEILSFGETAPQGLQDRGRQLFHTLFGDA